MRKFLLIMLALSCAAPVFANVRAAKIGALAPIGQDEKDILKWTENIAGLEGKSRMFRNTNEIVIFDDLNAMIMALRAGQIDRFSIGTYTAEYIAARNSDFQLIDNNHNAVLGLSIAIREDEREKLHEINRAINSMRDDGTLERLIRENISELGNEDPKAAELPQIPDAETLRVAITGDLPPMDCILSDGTPAGFNTAILAEISRRINKNIELISISAGARQVAISSRKVDAVFWARNVYTPERKLLPYPLDKIAGVVISEPYLLEGRAAVSKKQD